MADEVLVRSGIVLATGRPSGSGTGVIPINPDRNATKKDYEQLPKDTLLVTKVFYTFQGEGPFAGAPAVFVRLAGCNIGAKEDCPWCDTAFALDQGNVWDHVMLSDRIDLDDKARVVVFTGGEPLLQFDRVTCFMDHYRRWNPERYEDLTWQLETNGQLLRPDMLTETKSGAKLHYVVSPKIPHTRKTYPNVPAVALRDGFKNVYLKYVVSADPGSPYHKLPAGLEVLASHHSTPVFVSGMTVYRRATRVPGQAYEVANIWDDTLVDRGETAKNYAHAAALALRYGFMTTFQTHLFGVQE